MNKRIFLSHSSQDKDSVRRLAEDLRRVGIEVWLDEWEIRVGDQISRKIQEGLKNTDYLAVWLTRASVASGWVEREWQAKFGAEIAAKSAIILPLLAEDCELPPLLVDKRYADFRRDYQYGLADLLQVADLRSWQNSIGINFALIMPGAFVMGSDDGEENERPGHKVSIPRPFYMGIYVVTQGQWKAIMCTEPWKGDIHVREGDSEC
jgi:formylglycine-generating enzyme required for sulfatase activity